MARVGADRAVTSTSARRARHQPVIGRNSGAVTSASFVHDTGVVNDEPESHQADAITATSHGDRFSEAFMSAPEHPATDTHRTLRESRRPVAL
jgi:hypothetical protein